MRVNKIAMTVLLLGLLSSAQVQGEGTMSQDSGGKSEADRVDRRPGLGLSEDQRQKLMQLRTDIEKETIRKRAEMSVARIELRELIAQKNVDLNLVEKKIRQIELLRGDIRIYRVQSLLKAKGFLNTVQFEKFKRMVLFRAHHRRHGGQRRFWEYGVDRGYKLGHKTPQERMMEPGER